MIRKRMALLITALMIGGSALAYAFGPPPKGPITPGQGSARGADKFIERIAKDLGLSKEQKDRLLVKAKETEEEAQQIRARHKELFGKINQEMLKDSPDRKLLHGYIKQIEQDRAQMEIRRLDQMIDLRKELTADQKAKLEKIMKEKRERGKDRGKRYGRMYLSPTTESK